MNALLLVTIFFADTVVYPMQPEKIDPSTIAVTNEHPCGWWSHPYHERYRIMVDFDFDGHDDMLLSEPRASFGTGGGSWEVYHWTNGFYQAIGDIGAHYAAWSFDKDPWDDALRFWYYWHSSAHEGSLGYYIISANGVKHEKEQQMEIRMDAGENDVASQLYKTVLKDHGIKYRYEISSTTNGVVTWKTVRKL